MNKKNLIYILLIMVVVGVYYYYQTDDALTAPSTSGSSNQPVYQSEQMTTDVYDLSGEIIYHVESESVKHFDNSNNTEFDSPKFTLYDRENLATWYIQAKQATLTNDKLLYLYKDVQLDNLTPNAQLQQVKTDNAIVDLTTQMVTSTDPVTIIGTGFNSTGVGLSGDLQAKTAKILENVKTHYNTEAK